MKKIISLVKLVKGVGFWAICKDKYRKNQIKLFNYLSEHPGRIQLIYMVYDYLCLDFSFIEERCMCGGSDEIRSWERVRGPAMVKEIKKLLEFHKLKNEKQVGNILTLVILSMPMFFTAKVGSNSQAELDNYYGNIEKGDFSYFKGYLDLFKS